MIIQLFASFLTIINAVKCEEIFISPIYELGSYIPPLPSTGYVEPGVIKPLEILINDRFEEYDPKPIFVLGSNPPVSPIKPPSIQQIIPPGEPWPATADKTTRKPVYEINDRFDGPTKRPNLKPTTKKPLILEYQPNRPSFHPSPGNNVAQIVPPGEPWPAKPNKPTQVANKPSQVDKPSQSSDKPGKSPEIVNRFDQAPKPTTQRPLVLDYVPTRPFYHPNPGNNVGQIVPPGEPWPANADGYANFDGQIKDKNLEDEEIIQQYPGASALIRQFVYVEPTPVITS